MAPPWSPSGVRYVINGNSGKGPSSPADQGGFTGWTEFGVDPVTPAEADQARRNPLVEGPRWVAAEFHPHGGNRRLTRRRQKSPSATWKTVRPSSRHMRTTCIRSSKTPTTRYRSATSRS